MIKKAEQALRAKVNYKKHGMATPSTRDPETGQQETEKTVVLHVKTDPDEDENIPHPTLELYRHTLLRGANVGSLLTLLVGPPVLLLRGVRQPAELIRRLSSACVKAVVSNSGRAVLASYPSRIVSPTSGLGTRLYGCMVAGCNTY